ncbi:MAG: hypothetical protein WAL97_00695 [Halobacteriota archaeon]
MATTKSESPRSKKRILVLAGACGILAPIILGVMQLLAIHYSPVSFSWTQNWLCDLTGMGYLYFWDVSRPLVSSSLTEILSRSSYIVGGIFSIIFAIGLYIDDDAPSHHLGAVFAVLGAGALTLAGIFPAPMGLIHWVPGVASGVLLPVAMLLIGGALIDRSRGEAGSLSIAGLAIVLAIIALASAMLLTYGRAAAEMTSWIMIGVFAVVFSVRMLIHASHLA